ncbi:PEP-CTERM sorting domain-containing protein [Luteolibacter pohnpeiensis]|uniref:PEP-CTERM sorting domain-containing protein n=1 Tax=Luteolibacter pohnpeiensis TaxID=454153 RepID=A0A934S4Y2_9BACT|nr:PEP-CTERM sorting domain-containing protein [Luteolibacter pohnpeiensis]MBK1882347.1 PEP-CTERM sorting domain-containing protein [Luteolibacter pohnpeiensis]
MKSNSSFIAIAGLLATIATSNATVIGFGQLGGSNTTVPASLGSNASADGNGFTVANGTTPNITLSWDANWDIHTSSHFTDIENHTVGGGDWDNEGGIKVGQLDTGNHTISFTSEVGYALVLNSFDFGQTAETAGNSTWNLTLTDSSLNEVWQQTVNLDNAGGTAAAVTTISPGFVGESGETYTLTFNRTDATGPADGRVAIDNLSFNQVAVPEPSSLALVSLAGLGLLVRRRK